MPQRTKWNKLEKQPTENKVPVYFKATEKFDHKTAQNLCYYYTFRAMSIIRK